MRCCTTPNSNGSKQRGAACITFDDPLYERWNNFRQTEAAKYVALVLPHMLVRVPYGQQTQPAQTFDYDEGVDGTAHSKYLWGNSAYGLAARITNAFAEHGWHGRFRGVEAGGLVQNLPVHMFTTAAGDIALKCPTEVAITAARHDELSDLGFIPLAYYKGTDVAVFLSTPSCAHTDVHYTMAAGRFAHYLQSIVRRRSGCNETREDLQNLLNSWLEQYIDARGPLPGAHVTLVDIPGIPDRIKATLELLLKLEPNEPAIPITLELPLRR